MPDKKPAKVGRVRSTVTLDPDVAKIIERMQRDRGVGFSEAINDAVRAANEAPPERKAFVQTTSDMGPFLMPIDNTGELLDILDEEWVRKKLGQ